MAFVYPDPATGIFHLRFRYAGTNYNRSLKTQDARDAEAIQGRVNETLMLIERGRFTVPFDVDPAAFILSDGKRSGKPVAPTVRTLRDLFDLYERSVPVGAKESETLKCEIRHMGHLKRHLKASTIAQAIGVSELQRYVELRSTDLWNGNPIQPDTIEKELRTFRLIWNWGVKHQHLAGRVSLKDLMLPMRPEKPPFMTFDEIERRVARGGLSQEKIGEYWESLFLTKGEIASVLSYLAAQGADPVLLALATFVAHTGARRSELLRSELDDFDSATKMVQIREKKKSRKRSITYRYVPMTDQLAEAMEAWEAVHPGGTLTLCSSPNVRNC